MKERPLKLEQYGIDANRYRELKFIACQYADGQKPRDAAIQAAAKAADEALAPYLLRHAARGTTYEQLSPPCGINQFYAARRRFFAELDRRVWPNVD